MGLFGKGKDGLTGAEKDRAKAVAKHGVPGKATITAMTPTVS
jgi:hypothetical protein